LALTRAQKLFVAAGLLCILAGVFLMSLRAPRESREPVEMLVHQQQPTEVLVHVVGEVAKPGLYRLPAGSRINDAVKAAGGFTEHADVATVNLAAVLDDGQQISVGKVASARRTAESEQPPPSEQPTPAAPTQAPEMPVPLAEQGQQAVQTPPSYPARKVSLNRAGPEELELLPGIGPELARRICYYRREHGGFSQLEDLLKVKGVGKDTLEQIRPYVTL